MSHLNPSFGAEWWWWFDLNFLYYIFPISTTSAQQQWFTLSRSTRVASPRRVWCEVQKNLDREVTQSLFWLLSHSYSHKCQTSRDGTNFFTKIKWKRKSFNDSNSSIKPPMSQTTCSSFALSPLGHWLDVFERSREARHDDESLFHLFFFGRNLQVFIGWIRYAV